MAECKVAAVLLNNDDWLWYVFTHGMSDGWVKYTARGISSLSLLTLSSVVGGMQAMVTCHILVTVTGGGSHISLLSVITLTYLFISHCLALLNKTQQTACPTQAQHETRRLQLKLVADTLVS